MKTTIPLAPTGFLTAAELRQRWKVSGMHLWRLRRKGKLKVSLLGERSVRYPLAEIERFEREART